MSKSATATAKSVVEGVVYFGREDGYYVAPADVFDRFTERPEDNAWEEALEPLKGRRVRVTIEVLDGVEADPPLFSKNAAFFFVDENGKAERL